MSPRIYQTLQALILAALGGFFLQKIWSGTLYWYIGQRFMPLSLLAALGFLILAQASLPKRLPGVTPPPAAPHEYLPTRSIGGLLIVALPVLAGVLIPAKPLGAAAIANKGINTTAPLIANSQTARLDLASTDRNILDWIRLFNAASDPESFDGQPADVIGFVYQDRRLSAGQFLVGRFTINCCVADALAIGMAVEWPPAETLAANSWVRVRGPVTATIIDGQRLPLIQADAVESVPEPTQPYLYP